MKNVGLFVKKIVISYVVIFVILCSFSTVSARPYDSACGEYVSQ